MSKQNGSSAGGNLHLSVCRRSSPWALVAFVAFCFCATGKVGEEKVSPTDDLFCNRDADCEMSDIRFPSAFRLRGALCYLSRRDGTPEGSAQSRMCQGGMRPGWLPDALLSGCQLLDRSLCSTRLRKTSCRTWRCAEKRLSRGDARNGTRVPDRSSTGVFARVSMMTDTIGVSLARCRTRRWAGVKTLVRIRSLSAGVQGTVASYPIGGTLT